MAPSVIRARKTVPRRNGPGIMTPKPIAKKAQTKSKPKKTNASKGTSMPAGRSLLLDLPAELRNAVYEYVDTTVYLTGHARSNLTTSSALARVSRQVRQESLAVFYVTANICARVRNFDFRHVVTFLNRLSDVELLSLGGLAPNRTRTRYIAVELTIGSEYLCDLDLLKRWINRASHPTKKGARLEVSYSVNHIDMDSHLIYMEEVEYDYCEMPEGRSRRELGKIVAAMQNWIRP